MVSKFGFPTAATMTESEVNGFDYFNYLHSGRLQFHLEVNGSEGVNESGRRHAGCLQARLEVIVRSDGYHGRFRAGLAPCHEDRHYRCDTSPHDYNPNML